MYAVNIADMTKDVLISQLAVLPVCPSKTIVQAERGRVDGSALLMETDDQRAAAIVAIIRMKHPKHDIRCYQGSRKTWKRV